MLKAKVCGAVSILSVCVFLTVVGYLQAVQANYDPTQQLMSELVLGAKGEVMLFAFLAVALALLSLAVGFSFCGAQMVLTTVLVFAALCFVGAGIFSLGASAEIHIALVGLAFITSGLAMYLLPSCVSEFNSLFLRLTSWGMLASLALCVALGHSVISIGIGQRLAAFALLTWISFFGCKLMRL